VVCIKRGKRDFFSLRERREGRRNRRVTLALKYYQADSKKIRTRRKGREKGSTPHTDPL